MIFALAGRRIDLPDAEPSRFPLRNVQLVRSRLRALFEAHQRETLVCSAACGADLLALETAGALDWQRHVILPFDRQSFRRTSVTDRPGDWGALYDRILDQVESAGGLAIESSPAGQNVYQFTNNRILDEAARLAADTGERQVALVVWDGTAREPGDFTNSFAVSAGKRGVPVLQVSTLE